MQRNFCRCGLGDDLTGNTVRLPKRHANRAHQPIGQIGCRGVALAGGIVHARGVRRHIAHHPGHGGNRERQGRKSGHGALLVLLHVLLIGERQSLHHDQKCVECADDPAGLRAHQLGGIGIALLRHDRRAGGEGIGKRNKADQRRAPHDDLLGKPRKMYGGEGGRGKRLEHEIPIRYRVDRVRHWSIETQRLRGGFTIDGKGSAGKGGGTQWTLVQALARVPEPAAVPACHFHIREKMVTEGHRLCRLQVREPGHRSGSVLQRSLRQRTLIGQESGVDCVDVVSDPQPKIGGYLVIAGARNVQPSRRRPDQLGQPTLHVHVNVFERALELELAALDF